MELSVERHQHLAVSCTDTAARQHDLEALALDPEPAGDEPGGDPEGRPGALDEALRGGVALGGGREHERCEMVRPRSRAAQMLEEGRRIRDAVRLDEALG